jgi:hypothetical protein
VTGIHCPTGLCNQGDWAQQGDPAQFAAGGGAGGPHPTIWTQIGPQCPCEVSAVDQCSTRACGGGDVFGAAQPGGIHPTIWTQIGPHCPPSHLLGCTQFGPQCTNPF